MNCNLYMQGQAYDISRQVSTFRTHFISSVCMYMYIYMYICLCLYGGLIEAKDPASHCTGHDGHWRCGSEKCAD